MPVAPLGHQLSRYKTKIKSNIVMNNIKKINEAQVKILFSSKTGEIYKYILNIQQ